MKQRDHMGIVFELRGFAKITHGRAPVEAPSLFPCKLRKNQHGHALVLGEPCKSAGYCRHTKALIASVSRDYLRVVDSHELHAIAPDRQARRGNESLNPQSRSVDDM